MFSRVLVLIDGGQLAATDRAAGVVAWVRRLVRPTEAEVRLLAVCPPGRVVTVAGRTIAFADQVEGMRRDEALARLGGLAARLRADGLAASAEVSFEPMRRAAVEAVRRGRAELVAVTLSPGERPGRARAILSDLRSLDVAVLISRRDGQRAA
jgi:hypothetical protein